MEDHRQGGRGFEARKEKILTALAVEICGSWIIWFYCAPEGWTNSMYLIPWNMGAADGWRPETTIVGCIDGFVYFFHISLGFMTHDSTRGFIDWRRKLYCYSLSERGEGVYDRESFTFVHVTSLVRRNLLNWCQNEDALILIIIVRELDLPPSSFMHKIELISNCLRI